MAETTPDTDPVRRTVILARGLGTRMRAGDDDAVLDEQQAAVAESGVKGLIDVGRPFLDFVIEELAAVGITEVCLVIGPEHEALRDYAAGSPVEGVELSTAVQEEARGTADAVAAAADFAGHERVLVLNSDNFYPRDALAELVAAEGAALLGFDREALVERSNIPEDRLRSFAVVAAEDGELRNIVEKPDEDTFAALGGDAPVSMNAWLFTASIFEACARVEPSVRGEYEIIDAVRLLIGEGERFTVVPAAVGVLDLSSRGDVSSVAEALAELAGAR